MSNLFIKSIKVFSSQNANHSKVCDISIKEGKLAAITKTGELSQLKDQDFFDGSGLCICPSFVDVAFWQGEPGHENHENLQSSAELAKASGFGHLFIMPNTSPPINNGMAVRHLKDKSYEYGVRFHPVGALTKEKKGEREITEMLDMAANGAVCFSDGTDSISDLGLFRNLLRYSKMTGKLLVDYPYDKTLSPGGHAHACLLTEELGLNGSLPQAESLALRGQIEIAALEKVPFMAANLSSKTSVDILKEYKSQGQKIYSSVSLHNLIHTIEELGTYSTNLKLWPVLREEEDRIALVSALKDGTIDLLGSNHRPAPFEDKHVEFAYASYGALGLQVILPLLLKILGNNEKDLALLVEILSERPRAIFNLDNTCFEIGENADYCIFNPTEEWVFDKHSNKSLSANSNWLGQKLVGKCKALILKSRTG